jgi:hypothetical protein
VGITPKITDDSVLGVNGDAISIGILQRRRNNRTERQVSDFANALQHGPDLAGFNFELVRVIDVLIGAAATAAEVRAGGIDPLRRRFSNVEQLSFRQLLLFSGNFGRNELAVDRERNEHSFTVFTSDTFAAKGDVLDL